MDLKKQNLNYHLFDLLIANGSCFALYRLPGQDTVEFVCQSTALPHIYNDLSSLSDTGADCGFIAAPFCIGGQHPVVFISPDVRLSGEGDIFAYLGSLNLAKSEYAGNLHAQKVEQAASSTFEHYQKVYETFHAKLLDHAFEKLVLSRTLDVPEPPHFSVGGVFEKACRQYADNFIYLLHHPACGTWLGCTPEIILSGEHGQWKTDALAGTQAIKSTPDPDHIRWDGKNQNEQKIVVDYMQQQLLKLGISSSVQPPRTIRSGSLVHLRSEIGFGLADARQIFNVLHTLHPSPAVCGAPKNKAFDFINENEGYDRAYYAGFVGYFDIHHKTDLFVNLRCMQAFNKHLRLYAGGGILRSSELKSEWMETEHKLQTVLSLLSTH